MEAYRRVYDLCHLQADWQEPDQLRNPTLGNRVWATFTFLPSPEYQFPDLARSFLLLCSLAVLDPLVGHTMARTFSIYPCTQLYSIKNVIAKIEQKQD